jgi:hypothetical protein
MLPVRIIPGGTFHGSIRATTDLLDQRRRRSVCYAITRKDPGMPQMFDWIFFAIMLPFPAFLVWDFYRNRGTSRDVQQL